MNRVESAGGRGKKAETTRAKNRSCAIEIRWTVWSGFRWTSETPHKVNTHSGYDTLKYTRVRLCIYHRGFSHGIFSPTTEVGRIFFLFSFPSSVSSFSLSLCVYIFSFFFVRFPIGWREREKERRADGWLLGFETARCGFIFRLPRLSLLLLFLLLLSFPPLELLPVSVASSITSENLWINQRKR